jgi:hypothetical protein
MTMRCIFCNASSAGSASIEHVVPESLGDSTVILPRGIVCDGCNNYFSVKIEKPLLETGYFRLSRFRNDLASKRGRIPALGALHLESGLEVVIAKERVAGAIQQSLHCADERGEARLIHDILKRGTGRLVFPAPGGPPLPLLARFIAKIGLEILTDRVRLIPGWEEEVVFRDEIDLVREYARYGRGPTNWPLSIRRLYPENRPFSGEDGALYQVMHEETLLYTPTGELYAVCAILGIEYAINLGGPEIEGYEYWLKSNAGGSPLYPDGVPSIPPTPMA